MGKKSKTSRVMVVSVLTICLVAGILISVTVIHREEPPLIRERVDSFLTDVIGLNLTEHRIVQRYYAPYSNIILRDPFSLFSLGWDYGGIGANIGEHIQKQVSCTIHCPTGKMYAVLYLDPDTQMVDCYTQQFENNNFFAGPSPDSSLSHDVLNLTRIFLERYENYSAGASYISEMRKAMNAVYVTEPLNMTLGNIKVQISALSESYVTITLMYTSEGIDYDSKEVRLFFRNGALYYFVDSWNLE